MTNNLTTITEEMIPYYHEIGHWMIAKGLGYDGFITGDSQQKKDFIFNLTTQPTGTHQDLKNRVLIAFGGLGAEKLLNIPMNAGYIGDLTIACEDLKKLYKLDGKDFQFSNYMDFPDKEYEYYLTQSKIVLNQLGGKNAILAHGQAVYDQLKNL